MAATTSAMEAAAADAKDMAKVAATTAALRRERRGSTTEEDIDQDALKIGPQNNFVRPLLTDFYQISMAYACK